MHRDQRHEDRRVKWPMTGRSIVSHEGAMSVIQVLQFALNGSSAEQAAIAGNLANAQTPGYKAEDVTFQSSLAAALQNGGTATISESPSPAPPASDGNNVSLVTELVTAEEATLQYQALSKSLTAQFLLVQGAAGGKFT
jgi:flagellar basal-body rod protein FlgB